MTQRERQEVDWASVREEVSGHLQHLIRFNTVNPPGNELELARHIHELFTAEGVESQLIEPAPQRGTVIARVRGTGEKKPLLLMAHMDVVSVEPERWTRDPFGGELHDGFIYGRGAIDDKGMLAANLMTVLLLRRALDRGAPPLSRDVIFLATADEETGGPWGVHWVLANHGEQLAAEFAINEGGRIRVVDGRASYAAVQTTEKVSHVITLTARGTSGHASIPLPDNPIVHLGRALAAVGTYREPTQLNDTAREFFRVLAGVWPDEAERRAMADLVSVDHPLEERGARIIAQIPALDALLRNTISATILEGGKTANVIPAEARATLNVRTLPGESIDAVAERLVSNIGDRRVEVVVEPYPTVDPPPSSFDSPLFRALSHVATELVPGLAVAPYMSTGATDSAVMRQHGMQCYGLLPFPMDQGDENRMHSHDERISVDSLVLGVRILYETARRVGS